MKVLVLPTVERIAELLAFDERTGIFTWRRTRWAGRVAGAISGDGYLRISIDGHLYRAARLAFKISYGRDPVGQIDHKNCVRTDNRPENLREATQAQNNQNIRKKNRTGFKGVRIVKSRVRPWQATICAEGKSRHLGNFPTPEAAHAAYCKAAIELHGAFARFDSLASTIQKQPDAAVIGRNTENRVADGNAGAKEI